MNFFVNFRCLSPVWISQYVIFVGTEDGEHSLGSLTHLSLPWVSDNVSCLGLGSFHLRQIDRKCFSESLQVGKILLFIFLKSSKV